MDSGMRRKEGGHGRDADVMRKAVLAERQFMPRCNAAGKAVQAALVW